MSVKGCGAASRDLRTSSARTPNLIIVIGDGLLFTVSRKINGGFAGAEGGGGWAYPGLFMKLAV